MGSWVFVCLSWDWDSRNLYLNLTMADTCFVCAYSGIYMHTHAHTLAQMHTHTHPSMHCWLILLFPSLSRYHWITQLLSDHMTAVISYLYVLSCESCHHVIIWQLSSWVALYDSCCRVILWQLPLWVTSHESCHHVTVWQPWSHFIVVLAPNHIHIENVAISWTCFHSSFLTSVFLSPP